MRKIFFFLCVACISGCASWQRTPHQEHRDTQLVSWAHPGAIQTILSFLNKVDSKESSHYVPVEERVAVFDLDGTLVLEQPHYFEVSVALQKLIEDARNNPELGSIQPYKAALEGDNSYIKSNGDKIVLKAAESEQLSLFQSRAAKFLKGERHPKLQVPYDHLFYKPMKELIDTLKRYQFKVYIVSTSNQEFIRAFSTGCLGIEPEYVIGTMVAFEFIDPIEGRLFRHTSTNWEPYNANLGKVYRIRERTGALPIFAFGNSSGDKEMLTVTSASSVGMSLLLDHDDPIREYEYHSNSTLEEAKKRGWTVVSMKNDFKEVFTGTTCAP